MTALDALLADAAIPTSSRSFDVAAGLRRLAADAALTSPNPDLARAAQAQQRLSVVSRWVLNEPGAASHVDRLAEDPAQAGEEPDPAAAAEQLDIDGALVFGCLLYLTGHPESAEFWWKLAAGAGHRAAAYCLHLRHYELGEDREAQHWFHQLIQSMDDGADDGFFEALEVVAKYVGANGSTASAPTGCLEAEVERLASRAPGCGIVHRPDRRLADRLHHFASRR
ncbi:hypothetical protein [Streptomyces violaceusniger]|uniref:hypothetical protein n=1 Tax=Streptomyces violaceusniger TaxID=68280 RepID=UPI000998E0C9|nr:hypothetical protein [Streptomyces hygroscopicus]AQW46598.1 hypothetical protein SHXM_00061 [Streptomyces hygroscopicus]